MREAAQQYLHIHFKGKSLVSADEWICEGSRLIGLTRHLICFQCEQVTQFTVHRLQINSEKTTQRGAVQANHLSKHFGFAGKGRISAINKTEGWKLTNSPGSSVVGFLFWGSLLVPCLQIIT